MRKEIAEVHVPTVGLEPRPHRRVGRAAHDVAHDVDVAPRQLARGGAERKAVRHEITGRTGIGEQPDGDRLADRPEPARRLGRVGERRRGEREHERGDTDHDAPRPPGGPDRGTEHDHRDARDHQRVGVAGERERGERGDERHDVASSAPPDHGETTRDRDAQRRDGDALRRDERVPLQHRGREAQGQDREQRQPARRGWSASTRRPSSRGASTPRSTPASARRRWPAGCAPRPWPAAGTRTVPDRRGTGGSTPGSARSRCRPPSRARNQPVGLRARAPRTRPRSPSRARPRRTRR